MVSELNQFDAVSSIYDRLARLVFGSSLHDLQCHFLSYIPDYSTVLIIGGGTGILLKRVLEAKLQVNVIYVEASSKMISLSRQKVNNDSRVTFIHGTQDSIPTVTKVDVVITPFFLDLFSENSMKEVVAKLRATLSRQGIWIATDFCQTNYSSHRILLWIMYRFFRMTANIEATKLPRWENELIAIGRPIGEKTIRNGFVKSVLFKINE